MYPVLGAVTTETQGKPTVETKAWDLRFVIEMMQNAGFEPYIFGVEVVRDVGLEPHILALEWCWDLDPSLAFWHWSSAEARASNLTFWLALRLKYGLCI